MGLCLKHTHRTQNTAKIHTQKALRNGKKVRCFSSDPVPKGGCGHGVKDGSKSLVVTAKPPVQRSPEAAGGQNPRGLPRTTSWEREGSREGWGKQIQDCLNAMYVFTYSRGLPQLLLQDSARRSQGVAFSGRYMDTFHSPAGKQLSTCHSENSAALRSAQASMHCPLPLDQKNQLQEDASQSLFALALMYTSLGCKLSSIQKAPRRVLRKLGGGGA